MFSVDRFLGLAGMGSAIANVSLLRRFLSGLAIIVALTAIGSTLAGVLLAAGFYVFFISLIHHGLDPMYAGSIVGGLALAIILILGALAISRMRQLREMPQLLPMDRPLVQRVSKIAEAFLTGLLSEHTPRR